MSASETLPAADQADQVEGVRRPAIPPLAWVRPPQQARSQKTYERLLDAAEAVITEQGVQALTVSAVVGRAKSSVGAFYARFSDKAGLLRTLHQRECEQAVATTDLALDASRWEGLDLSEALEQIIRFVVRLFVERRGLVMAFRGVATDDSSFIERHAGLQTQIAERLHRFLSARTDEIEHPDLDLAADVAVRMLLGTLETEVAIRGSLPADRAHPTERIAAELTRAMLGYLGAPVSARLRRKGGRMKGLPQ